MLETLTPDTYQVIRRNLGDGGGQESPGFNAVQTAAPYVVEALAGALDRAGLSLAEVYLTVGRRGAGRGLRARWVAQVDVRRPHGFLYAREDLLPGLRPAATGWFASGDPLSFAVGQDWAADARRLAGGTPIPLTAMMSRVGLNLLREVGIDAIRAHSLRCTERVLRHADEMTVPVLTPREPARRGGVVTLDLPKRAKELLAERGMICSWRDGLGIAPHF